MAVAMAATAAVTVILPPQRIARFSFASLLEQQTRRELHQLALRIRHSPRAVHQLLNPLSRRHRRGYSLAHGMLLSVRSKRRQTFESRGCIPSSIYSNFRTSPLVGLIDIVAGGEVRSRSREDDDPDIIVGRERIECIVQGIQQIRVLRIACLWTIERNACDSLRRMINQYRGRRWSSYSHRRHALHHRGRLWRPCL